MQINLVKGDLIIANSPGKEIKQNTLWKKIILKGNITTKYIEYKHKNTGTSSCNCIRISRLQCFTSFTKCCKTVSLKPCFGLSVEIWSRFSRFVLCNRVFTSFLLRKNLWIFDKLDLLIHEKNISWEVATPNYTVHKKI